MYGIFQLLALFAAGDIPCTFSKKILENEGTVSAQVLDNGVADGFDASC
jgi:hypothetical protein